MRIFANHAVSSNPIDMCFCRFNLHEHINNTKWFGLIGPAAVLELVHILLVYLLHIVPFIIFQTRHPWSR